jgi:sugar phosphate isomerase/epimerase
MKLSGAAWSFVGTTLHESVAIYRALGITAIDLIAIPGTTLDSQKLIQGPAREAERIKVLDAEIGNIIFLYAPNFSERALNHQYPEVRKRNTEEFHAVVEFCWRCSIPSITVLPGVAQRGWARKKSLAVSAEILNELAAIASEKQILLCFEAHVGSILDSPKDTLAFLEANPILKLTLDYSHFVFNGYSQKEIDPLQRFSDQCSGYSIATVPEPATDILESDCGNRLFQRTL